MNAAFTILIVLIVLAAILLIAVVLLQNGKDGGLATNFTSANQTLGVRQTATILEKATWWLVGILVVLCLMAPIVWHNSTGSKPKTTVVNQQQNANNAQQDGNTATPTAQNE